MPSEKKIKTQKQKQKEEGGRATPFGQRINQWEKDTLLSLTWTPFSILYLMFFYFFILLLLSLKGILRISYVQTNLPTIILRLM